MVLSEYAVQGEQYLDITLRKLGRTIHPQALPSRATLHGDCLFTSHTEYRFVLLARMCLRIDYRCSQGCNGLSKASLLPTSPWDSSPVLLRQHGSEEKEGQAMVEHSHKGWNPDPQPPSPSALYSDNVRLSVDVP